MAFFGLGNLSKLLKRKDSKIVENEAESRIDGDADCVVHLLVRSPYHYSSIQFDELLYHFSKQKGLVRDEAKERLKAALRLLCEKKRLTWGGSETDGIGFNKSGKLLGV